MPRSQNLKPSHTTTEEGMVEQLSCALLHHADTRSDLEIQHSTTPMVALQLQHPDSEGGSVGV